ncbi:MAG: hypothetical protein RBS56_04255 [Candidatus Gracilibacteria bacterium]|nr:hypothetical protein [Candidatus Gracilibacteria bacterium]
MNADTFHPCIHVFTNYWIAPKVQLACENIKSFLFNDPNFKTSFEGPFGRAQVSIQTEMTVAEFSGHSKVSDAFDLLDQRLDALFEAGFAVHLLLPLHEFPKDPYWQGIDWTKYKNSWPGGFFDPYQPSLNADNCAYDLLSELFQKPIIEHLIETGRMENISVIYLLNEFAYPSNTLLDNASNWDNDPDWKNIRAQALFQTAKRILNNGRTYANGSVPVGLKFAELISPNTGFTPWNSEQPDQLENITNLMRDNDDVFAYDLYFNDGNNFDEPNRNRILPFLKDFKPGFFEIGESAYWCEGGPDQFTVGRRTNADDISGAVSAWEIPKGYNLFGWNTGSCFAIADDSTQLPYPDSFEEAKGIIKLIEMVTGKSVF